jgi:hypothetical protein
LDEEAKKATGLKAVFAWYSEGIKGISKDWLKIDLDAKESKKILDGLYVEWQKNLRETEHEIELTDTALEASAITAEEADKRRLASAESYLQKLIETRTAVASLAGAEDEEVARYDRLIEAQRKSRDELAATIALREKDTSAADYEAQLKNIADMERAMSGTAEQTAEAQKRANQERQSANEAYLKQLIEIRNKLLSMEEPDMVAIDNIRQKIRLQSDLLKEQQKQNAPSGKDESEEARKKQEAITAAYEKAEAKRAEAIRIANRERDAGLITEIQLRDKVQQAMQTEEADMKAIVEQYGLSTGRTVEKAKALEDTNIQRRVEIKSLDEETAKEKELQEIMTGIFQTREEQILAERLASGEIETQIEYENRLIDLTRERERAKLDAHLTEIKASEDERESVLADFDRVTEGMKKPTAAAKTFSEKIDDFFSSDAWSKGMQMASGAVQAFSSIANSITQAQNDAVKEQVEEIDKMLDAELEDIEKLRQKALEEAGFAEELSQENLQAKIDAAMEAGDEILAFELQRRLQEKEINDKYDAMAKAAEEKSAKEKAELEYKAAKAQWEMSLSQAIANAAMAVLSGYTTPPFLPVGLAMGSMALAAGAVQVDTIKNNPPKLKYESGGLVPGRSFSGDNIPISANSGERILTMDNQEFLLAATEGRGSGEVIQVVSNVYLDKHLIAVGVAEEFNTAKVTLKERAIEGRR